MMTTMRRTERRARSHRQTNDTCYTSVPTLFGLRPILWDSWEENTASCVKFKKATIETASPPAGQQQKPKRNVMNVDGPAPRPAARCHLSQVSRTDHDGSVIVVDSVDRTDLPLCISEVRDYECGRFGSKLAHISGQTDTHLSQEKLHADRATHTSIVVVDRRTLCRVGYNVRACDHAVFPCRW